MRPTLSRSPTAASRTADDRYGLRQVDVLHRPDR
jgi:hypothetical protein